MADSAEKSVPGSPEWLPPGWVEQLKVLRSGREVRCFMNVATMQKFFSKEDVIQFVTKESCSSSSSQPKNELIKLHEGEDQIAAKNSDNAEENPDWLPNGWITELKLRMSGQRIGEKYHIYVDPSSGRRFYSKPDVLRHLETIKSNNCSTLEETGSDMQPYQTHNIDCPTDRVTEPHSTPETTQCLEIDKFTESMPNQTRDNATLSGCNVLASKDDMEGLPPGWIKEIKDRKKGSTVKSEPIYIDPISGYMFSSRRDVFRYLETGDIRSCKKRPQRRGMSDPVLSNGHTSLDINSPTDLVTEPHSQPETTQCLEIDNCTESLPNQTKDSATSSACNVLACKHDLEGLPPGWIKEMKPRQKGSTVKSDPFYIDPVSGYMFRSRKDVFRYLETGDIRSCKIRPQRRGVSDPVLSNGHTSPLSGDGHQLTEAAPRAQLLADENISDVRSTVLPKSGSTKKRSSEHMSAESIPSLAAKAESPKKKASLEIANGNCGKSDIICDIGVLPLSKSESSARNGSREVNKSKRQGGLNLPRRASKRLAGFGPELLVDSASGRQAHSATRHSPISKANELGQSASNISEDVEYKQRFADPEVELIHHASDANTPFCGQPTPRRKFPLEGQLALGEMETNDVDDGKPTPEFVNRSSNSHPDTCLKFPLEAAISEIPKGATANEKPSSNLITNIPEERATISKKENSRRGRASIKSNNAKRKEPKWPSQVSKGLTGFQSYEEVNLSSEPALQFVSRNFSKNEAHVDASSIRNCIADVAAQKPKAFSGIGVGNQSFVDVKGVSPESSNRCLESPALSSVQRQEMEALHFHGKAESGLNSSSGDSWTDPCLDFAIKTLTGAIPVPDTVGLGLVSSPTTGKLKQNLVDSRIEQSNKVESNKYKNKNKLVLPCQSSEEVAKVRSGKLDRSGSAGYQLISTSSSSFKLDTGFFHDNIFDRTLPKFEAAPPTVLADQAFSHDNIALQPEATNSTSNHERLHVFGRALPKFEAAPPSVLADQVFSHNNITLWPESSHNSFNLERQSVPGPAEQLQKQESVRMSLENLDSQFFLPFGEPWYDPCLEFAYKTLTGALPVDNNLEVQDYLSQHHLGTMQPQRNCGPSLPDINLPSVPQNDVPEHFDGSDKNVFRQQQPFEFPNYTPANVSSGSQHPWQEADKKNLF